MGDSRYSLNPVASPNVGHLGTGAVQLSQLEQREVPIARKSASAEHRTRGFESGKHRRDPSSDGYGAFVPSIVLAAASNVYTLYR